MVMTLGQRIQELRKQRGMSQEALGDALGVSRQAVSKWEGDNGIPELDTLIAMSRLFEVTVGQLLGVEEVAKQKYETTNEAEEDKEAQVEAVLRRYVEQTTKKDERSWLARQGWIVSVAIILTTAFIVMFAQIGSLRSTVRLLRSDLSNLQVDVSNNQSNLTGHIRNTIYDVLTEEANLLSTFEWEIVDFDLDNQTATLRFDATMKEYAAGSKLQFCAAWTKVDDTEGKTDGDWVGGPNFQSEITLPLNYNTVISIRVEDADGNIKEQVIQTPLYELHPDNFHLYARNLTTPFAITTKGFGITSQTAKAEQAYIVIESIFPDFFWPEKAEVTAYVNDVEVMSEVMTIAPSGREKQIFNASIKDTYYDLTLENGDTLEIVLVVTDNLGRTEQFTTDSMSVQDGELQRKPAAAPMAPVG
jgi:transcriptional regulator with XRE-family HTH domain